MPIRIEPNRIEINNAGIRPFAITLKGGVKKQ